MGTKKVLAFLYFFVSGSVFFHKADQRSGSNQADTDPYHCLMGKLFFLIPLQIYQKSFTKLLRTF